MNKLWQRFIKCKFFEKNIHFINRPVLLHIALIFVFVVSVWFVLFVSLVTLPGNFKMLRLAPAGQNVCSRNVPPTPMNPLGVTCL